MSPFFTPQSAALQAVTSPRRKRYPYGEIPLDDMEMVAARSESPQELPLAQMVPMAALQAGANASPQANFEHVTAPRGFQPSTPTEIPLGNIPTVQPLSREQELDLAPIEDKRRSDLTPNEQAAIARKISIPEQPTRPIVERGGILGTLKHIGKGALLGLARGGLGGAIAGAIGGGVAPQATSDIQFRDFTMPKYEREREAREGELKNQEALIGDVAARTGLNPVTGQPTEQRRDRMARDETNRLRNEQINADRDAAQATRDRNATTAEKRAVTTSKNMFLSRIAPNTPLDKINQAYRAQFGEDLPEGFDPHKHKFVDTGETWENVDQFSGQSSTVTNQGTGKPIPSAKAAQAGWAMERARAYIGAGMSKQAAELQVRRELAEYNQGQVNQRAASDRASRENSAGYKGTGKKGVIQQMIEEGRKAQGSGEAPVPQSTAPAQGGVMSRAKYNEMVKKHGAAKVDGYVRDNGITVQ